VAHIDTLLNRLDGVKTNSNNKWLAKCPAHDDRSPSLAIKLVDDDKILLKCWAGCEIESVLAAIGLTFVDLFPEKINVTYDRRQPRIPRFSCHEMFPLIIQESLILCLTISDVMKGELISETDLKRTRQAYKTIMRLNNEFKG
jgi:hypothetical protein